MVKSNSFVTLELSMTVRLRLQVHFWIRISLVTPSFWHIVLIILTQYTHVSKLMSFLDIGQLILPCAENCSTNATQIHISWGASPLCPYWPTFYLLSILANFLSFVHIDQLFIFCPYWPIFLFLFSLEHQIGKRRPVHIDQVPIFLFRNKVENLGPWCTWDKSQVVASALLHCSASLQQNALVLHWVVFQWCCSIFCVTVVPLLAVAVSQFCSATVFQGTCNMITPRCCRAVNSF